MTALLAMTSPYGADSIGQPKLTQKEKKDLRAQTVRLMVSGDNDRGGESKNSKKR